MAAQNPRTRLVVFRVTPHEYDALKKACASKGGHTLSDFTRTELLSVLDTMPGGGPLQERFTEMATMLGNLQRTVDEIKVRLISNGETAVES